MNKIRLTESQLNRVIKESMRNVLMENDEEEGFLGRIGGAIKGAANAVKGEYRKASRGMENGNLGDEYKNQSLGKRWNAAKNMIKGQAKYGDSQQTLNNLCDYLYKLEQNGYFEKDTQVLADKLYKAIKGQLNAMNNLRVKGNYKRGYGEKMPQTNQEPQGMGYSRRTGQTPPVMGSGNGNS